MKWAVDTIRPGIWVDFVMGMLARLTAKLVILICTPYCEIKMSAGNFGSQVILCLQYVSV